MIWPIVALMLLSSSVGVAEHGRKAMLDSLGGVENRLGKNEASTGGDYAALGEGYARAREVARATEALERAVKLNPQDPDFRYTLGRLYFQRAVGKGLKAIDFRRKAMLAARQLQEVHPQYAPTYLLLANCYEWLDNDSEQATKYYLRFLEMRPDDPEGLLGLGRVCLDLKDFKRIEQTIVPYCDRHPTETQLLPILAQVDLLHRRPEQAAMRFRSYITALSPEERAHFEDISTVASTGETAEFARATAEERPAFLKRFWEKRDPDVTTEVSEAEVEHYRRVWYASTYFGRLMRPWDRRGEVYIRYGEPDSRSRAGRMEVVQSEAVQRVKERMAQTLFGIGSQDVTYVGPVFPVRSRYAGDVTVAASLDKIVTNPGAIVPRIEDVLDNQGTELGTQLQGAADAAVPTQLPKFSSIVYAPVTTGGDHSLVLWESWIYTGIGGGVEVTFTDELNNGTYDFAPIPPADFADDRAIANLSRLSANSPQQVVMRVSSDLPSTYGIRQEGEALDFYYDTADYRGEGGMTRVEIAYGLPTKEMRVLAEGDSVTLAVERAVALATKDRSQVYRVHEGRALVGKGSYRRQKGEFYPDLVKLEVPPGQYDLAVQIVDRVSGRAGIYKQELAVKPYGTDRLQLSDVSLAYAVVDHPAGESFRKGDVWVLPMPTRSFGPGQNAAAYYEVYNLQRDAGGHTRYRVEYSVRSDVDEGEDPLSKAIAGVKRFIRRRKPQVSFAHERAGVSLWDAGYITLDMRKVKPGRNLLRVTVTDLVGGQEVAREAAFRYGR